MKQKGFTLVELILSVAMLAIISLFILQYFIAAKNMTLKAKDLDESVLMVQMTFEAFKSNQKVEDFQKSLSEMHLGENNLELEWTLTEVSKGEADRTVNSRGSLYQLDVKVVRRSPYLMASQGITTVYESRLVRYFKEKEGEAHE
jgi:prepilin-type N-terminal cleavage/methylation domain-containing protein